MKISQIFGFANSVNFAKKSVAKQDLTSFGEEQTQSTDAELVSKDAAKALKDKYMSQVSFSGYFKTFEVEEHGSVDEILIYNTCGQVVGHTGQYKYCTHDYTVTPKDDKDGKSVTAWRLDTAMEDAIRKSDGYIPYSDIKKKYSFNPNLGQDKHRCYADVYFTYKNEKVDPVIHENASYVVYAPGAHDVYPKPPVQRKKSLWEKIFG